MNIFALQKYFHSIFILGFGGGGDAPDPPNYAELAKQQAADQLKLNRSTTKANRINQYTPWGSITYQQGGGVQPTFNQAAYDKALEDYQRQLQSFRSTAGAPQTGIDYWMQRNQGGSSTPMPVAPNPKDFYSSGGDPDKWSQTVTLNPELQKILDQNFAGQQQSYEQLQNALNTISQNNLPLAPVNAGETAQEAILRRVNPELDRQEEALRTRLYNQGVRPGTPAWDREMNVFNQQKNDAVSQAALQGISVGNDARARALAEQGIPINLINAYLSGGQAQMPQFGSYAPQNPAMAPDLMGAAQANYAGQLNAYNASKAAGSNFMTGLFGLGGAVLGGPIGGALGAALSPAAGGTSIPIDFSGFKNPFSFA